MILTCPECATSYFVDDGRIPRRGRTVKCSSCDARWKAYPEGEVEEEVEPPVRRPILAETRPAPPDDDIEFVAPILPVRKPKPKGGRGLLVGVVVVGGLAVSGAAAVAFREQVARAVPATAPLFAAIGLPVNTVGLAFEGVVSKPILVAGRPVMAVTGAIRNTTKAAIASPPVRISLLDKDKAVLRAYDIAVSNSRVPPGGVRYFAWSIPDPPAGAVGLEVAFNPHAKPAPPAAPAPPAPVDAKPLPADSPDALPHHE